MDLQYSRFPKDTNLKDHNAIHIKFRWVGKDTMLYFIEQMNAFTLEHVIQRQKDTNTYFKQDTWSSKWLNALIISSSTDKLNIEVNENFYLRPIIEKGGILHLTLMLDDMLSMFEAVLRTLNTWLKLFPRRSSKRQFERT